MQSPPAVRADCLVGRSWPDNLDRRAAERRNYTKPAVLDTRVDIDPTQPWLGDVDRRHAERRQYKAKPSGFGAFA